MTEAGLETIRDLRAMVDKRSKESEETSSLPPQAVALAQRIREEALAYWREAKLLAKVGFGTQPDLLAKFRTGVQTGLLIANLTKELESTVALLREHSAQLSGLGGNDTFIARGEALVARLKEVKGGLDAACGSLPAPAAQQCHDKGLLYHLTRKLVRVGRLEFAHDPDQASEFNFTGVRRDPGVSTRPQMKKAKTSGR
jgi:hypothetical protein